MKLRDESFVDVYILKMLDYIQSNTKLCKAVNNILLDSSLYAHSANVSRLATQLAISLDFSEENIRDVCLGGLLHDIGKIKTPNEILYKPDKLTKEEFEVIKKHPLDGYNILKDTGVNEKVLNIVLKHHEKIDGSGYPDGVVEKTLLEDIVTIADIFSALTEQRVYRNTINIQSAFDILNNSSNLNHDLIKLIGKVIC